MTIETLAQPGALASENVSPLVDLAEWVGAASQAHSLVNGLVDSFFVPEAYKVRVAPNASPEDRAAARAVAVANGTGAVLLGRSLGVDPLTALQQIYVVHGRPGMYAKFKVALATAAGAEIWTDESTDDSVTVSGTAKGLPRIHAVTITMEMAKRAGWLTNANYAKTPQDMLWARAAGRVADRVAPHVLFGIQSIEDIEPEPERPKPTTRVSAADILSRPAPEQPAVSAAAEPSDPEPPATDLGSAPEAPALISPAQVKKLQTVYAQLGVKDRAAKLGIALHLVGRKIESATELTKVEATALIDGLERLGEEESDKRAAAIEFMTATAEEPPSAAGGDAK